MYLPDRLQPESPGADSRFTLPALVAWLRTKPGNETYCYMSNGKCLIGQYLKERCGISEPSVGGENWRKSGSLDRYPLPVGWNAIAMYSPWTFSAALARAERLMEAGR